MGGGAVGATDLLRSTHGECFVTDMAASPSHLADEVIACNSCLSVVGKVVHTDVMGKRVHWDWLFTYQFFQAVQIERIAQDTAHCTRVGRQAMSRARAWTQLANATDLMSIVQSAIAKSAS